MNKYVYLYNNLSIEKKKRVFLAFECSRFVKKTHNSYFISVNKVVEIFAK